MKYLSIDIETTGVDPELDQILSIGVVIEDTEKRLPLDELPSLHLVIIRERLKGNVFALNMNKDIVGLLKQYQISSNEARKALEEEKEIKFVLPHMVTREIYNFLAYHGISKPQWGDIEYDGHMEIYNGKSIYSFYDVVTKGEPITSITCAGKNFGTFDKLFLEKLKYWKDVFKIHQRIIDPAILYWNPQEDGDTLPNLNTCMKRANIDGEVTHDAVADAKDVIKVIRHLKY